MSVTDKKPTWPGWETVRLIGRGSFGAVYEIERDLYGNKEKAALKVVSIPQSESDIEDLKSDGYDRQSITARFEQFKQDIIREYSMMADMKGCANIVYCDDTMEVPHDDGIGWDILIKMELLAPINKALDGAVAIPEKIVIKIGEDICRALAFCEKRNVIHRDIKPQNIFIASDGTYKLGDFGIAKTVERTTSGTKTGTYKYMAPEVYNNQPYGNKTDIYSLGLVLYWLLNEKRTPFLPLPPAMPTASEEDRARLRRFQGEQIKLPAHGSEGLKQIVLKACAYDPKDRYQSAADMLEDLERVKAGEKPLAAIPLGGASGVETDQTYSAFYRNDAQESGTVGPYDRIRDNAARDNAQDQSTAADNIPNRNKKRTAILAVAACLAVIIGAWAIVPKLGMGSDKADDAIEEEQLLPEEEQTEEPVDAQQEEGEEKETEKELQNEEPQQEEPASETETSSSNQNTQQTEKPKEEQKNTQPDYPVQSDWSSWAESLPSYVSDANYSVEKRTLYSSRKLETTSSTSQSSMNGWELYNTTSGNGDYGPWSNWSQNSVSRSSTRDVETETRYRYRDRETTTSSDSNKSGWSLDRTEYNWSDYGSWSGWSTDSVSGNDRRKVETKTQYRYRDSSYYTDYSDWSDWSGWQDGRIESNEFTQVETRQLYAYYYFRCPNCGAHMHGWGITCPTWAGGCGRTTIPQSSWTVVWSTTSHSSAGFKDWHGTGKYYAYINGELVFKWNDGMDRGEAVKTQYCERRRSTVQRTSVGDWSSWSDTSYSSSDTREVQTRTLYRYRDRDEIATYYYSRWGNWSDWSTTPRSSSSNRQVDTTTFYRYRDKTTVTTYYFRRWTGWSDYSTQAVSASDSVQVQTKVQYRYKSK